MNDKQYIVNYWNVPGRGESVRVMLALGEINFKNNYIPLPFPMKIHLD